MGASIPPVGPTPPPNVTPAPGTPPNGMRRLIAAMSYFERKQEVVSNNVANVSTPGYKGQQVFAQLLNGALPVANAQTDFSAGSLKPTDNALDLALTGTGFLMVQTPRGERLARGGSFTLDDEGRIVDAQGNLLLGEPNVGQAGADGVLRVPEHAGEISVSRDGGIFLADTTNGMAGAAARPVLLGRLRMATVADPATLRHEAGTLFFASAGTVALPQAERRGVRQGFLEESNVNPMSAMVDMIAIQRTYADIQKAAVTLDGVRGIAASDLGKVP